jgi:HEAT repeat protein
MSNRVRSTRLACGLALLLTAPFGLARSEHIISPEMRQALHAAKTVRLEVRQDYDLHEEPVEDMTEEDRGEGDKSETDKSAAGKPEEPRPEEKYTLPLAELAEQAVKLAGWKLARSGEATDVTITMEVHGTPVGATYTGSLSGYRYTGAELKGSVQLTVGGQVVTEEGISAEIPIEPSIHSTSFNYRTEPRDAPFGETLPEYCKAVFTMLGRAWGPGPVVAGLKLENSDLHTGAGRALLEVGDASVEPALIRILGEGDESLARIAALGLGVHGGPAALPALLAALRKVERAALPTNDLSPFDEPPDTLTEALEVVQPPERAFVARETLDGNGALHRAVEWALLQIEAPDKLDRLAAALQERDAVMLRRGAAVVLGGMEDRRAFESLAAATGDKEPLVRAAALSALGRLNDGRTVDILMAASDDATGYVSKLARAHLAEAGQERWDKFLGSRDQADALLDGFKHPDPLVRAAAARVASYSSDPEIKAGLAALLRSDPRALVREAAVQSLAEDDDHSDAPLLAAALGDTDAATRRRAVDALTRSSEEEPDADAGEKIVRSRLPETALAPVLALLTREEVDEAQVEILLGRIEGPGVADKLLQALQGDGPAMLLRLAARRLAGLGEIRAGPPLLALLGKATDPYAGQFVADALVTLDDPAVLEPLFGQLKTGTPTARRLAMNVLGRLRQPRAIGPLIAALRAGENNELGGDARQALETLTGQSFSTGDEWLRWWKENAGKPFVPPPSKVPAGDTPVEKPAEEPK